MRRLMWFTIGFAAACAVAIWLIPDEWILPAALTLGLLGVVLSFCNRHTAYRVGQIALFGCALGLIWFFSFQTHYLDAAAQLDGKTQAMSLTIADYSYETGYGIGVDAATVVNDRTYRIRVYLDKDISLDPGDVITGDFRLRYTFSKEASDGTYHAGNGIFLLGYQSGEVSVKEASQLSVRHLPAFLSRRLELAIQTCFPEDTVPFAKALLLGKTMELVYEVDTNLKISGIRHVAAVSGLHVAILIGFIYLITLKKPVLTAVVGIPVLALFAALAGFTPSVCRACIMSGLMMLGRCIDREYDGVSALSFAVLVMLIANPLSETSVSLQLSAFSVAGIFLFYEPIYSTLAEKLPVKNKWLLKLLRAMAASVAVTLSAMSLTTPFCAIYFGAVSLVGVVTNLLTLWVISFVFYGIAIVCALHFVWHSGAVFLAGLVSVAIRYVLLCADILSSFPLAAVYTKSIYIVFWLAFCYGLFAAFWIGKVRRPQILTVCVVFSLLCSILFSWLEPLTDNVRMTVLDVGQGQSILLQSEGKTFLVDCGGDNDKETADTIAETLLSQGIHRIDGIIVTHYDQDHCGALSNLLTRVHTDILIGPESEESIPLPKTDATFICVSEDVELTFGETSIKVFGSGYVGSGNENSLCILFERENCAILITGDRSRLGEKLLLRKASLPKLDVLVAGHHGAEDSTSEVLLEATRPEIVMISVGEDNIYSHPAPDLLDRLYQYGCEVYRTDQNGTILFRR